MPPTHKSASWGDAARFLMPALLALALLWAGPAARASTLTVTSGADSGSGTLRAAAAAANAGDTIVFSGVTTIALTSGEIALTKPITISGPGVTISAGGSSRVFEVVSGPTTLSGLTITQGHANNGSNGNYAGSPGANGGGVLVDANAAVTLSGCTLSANSGGGGGRAGDGVGTYEAGVGGDGDVEYGYSGGTGGGGGGGAGGSLSVSSGATVTVSGCTLSANSGGGGGSGGNGGGDSNTGNKPGPTGPTSSGGNGGDVYSSGTLMLGGCALTGSSANVGGALYNDNGATATLTVCDLSNNSDLGGNGNGGGALFNAGGGTVTLTRCRISHNQDDANSDSGSGGGGGICNEGVAALTECTLSDNVSGDSQAPYQGGGGFYNTGQAMLNECTLSGNSANLGSAILNYAGTMTLTNDTVYGDHSATNLAEIVAYSGNSVSATYCDIQGGYAGTGNLSADPRFVRAPGTTSSADAGDLHLQAGSPCIGVGNGSAPGDTPFDLDGAPRRNPPTIGAYEGSGYALVVTNTSASGSGSLAAAVASANANPGAVITFDPSVFETRQQTIALSNGFNITARMTISGPPQGVVLDGGNASRIFYVNSGATVALSGLQIQFGRTTSFGGALYSEGSVTLIDCILAQNSASSGGAVFTRGMAALIDCVLIGNSATYGGGLYNASSVPGGVGGTAVLTGCTLAGNSATYGGGVCNGNASTDTLTLTDDILWGDDGEVYTSSNPVGASFCDIQGGATAAITDGGGNFSADPLFDGEQDSYAGSTPYALQPGSPCIGAGTANAPDYLATDLDGVERPNPPTVGAYEGQQISTRTMLTSSLNPAVYGQSVTFTAAVVNTATGAAPTGTVQFTANNADLGGPVPVGANGMATVSTTALPTGSDTIQAAYSGDGAHTGGSTTLVQTVLVANMTALASSLNPSVYGQSVTFTATVNTYGGPTPQGSVQFAVDGVNAGAPVPLTGSQASFATSTLALGGHTITAAFTGNGFESSSASFSQTVTPASVTGVSVGWGAQTAPLTTGAALPWLGISKLIVTLNAPAGLAPGDISLTGKAVANYGPVTLSQNGSVYTVTLAKPITIPDRLTLSIGNAGLNGYSASFTVLPGDVNGDGAVNASDMTLVKNAIGGAYKQTDDIDGSGVVDITDYNDVRARVGTKLP